jgi:hypothetical protein
VIIRVLLILVFAHGPPLVGHHQRKGYCVFFTSMDELRLLWKCLWLFPTPGHSLLFGRALDFAWFTRSTSGPFRFRFVRGRDGIGVEMQVMGLKLCVLLIFYIGG